MYSDPEQLAKLNEHMGKSQVEIMAEYRARLAAEKASAAEKIQKEREETESQLRSQHEEHIQKMKKQLEEEQTKETSEIELKRQNLLKQKEEFEKKQQDEAGKLHNEEKQRILAKFEKDLSAVNQSLDHERSRRKSKLESRLAMQRKTKMAAKKQVATSGMSSSTAPLPTVDERSDTQSQKPLSTSGNILQSADMSPAVAQTIQLIDAKLERINKVISVLENGGALSQGGGLDTAKIERIDRIMSALEVSGILNKDPQTASQSTVLPEKKVESPRISPGVYVDSSNPPQGEALVVVSDDKLSVQEHARLDFGRHLAEMIGLTHVKIEAASSLPPSDLANNSFKNSYLYDESSQVLYIHTTRLSSSGDFGLVAIHALSHIKVNPSDMSDDSNPQFTAEFYTNLRILSQDLYKRSAAAGSLTGNAPVVSSPLDRRGASHLRRSTSTGRRPSISSSGSRRSPAQADYFSTQTMHERIKQYAQVGGIPSEFLDRYVQESKPEEEKEEIHVTS